MTGPSLLIAAAIVAASVPGVSAMKWERRVLLICAPTKDDAAFIRQRRVVAGWTAGAEERDLTVVEIVGNTVMGARDPANSLRQRYGLPADAFSVILIGKDGGVKLRRTAPIPASTLEGTIDAMPMRRGGAR